MLTLRNEQEEIFRKASLRDFKYQLFVHLQETLPHRGVVLSQLELERQLSEAMEKASFFGLTRACDVARFAELGCVYLGGFLDRPHPKQVSNILCQHGVDPEEKLNRLEEWAKAHPAPSAAVRS